MHASMCGAACALAVVVLLPLTAVGALYADIQADRSTMADGGATIVTGGHSYSIATKHDMGENVFYPTITTAQHYKGSSSFFFEMDPNTSGHTPGEKDFINLVQLTDSYAPTWKKEMTVGFSVCLADNFQAPNANQPLMLSEWWQGSPYGPPIQMAILPGTTQWAVGIANVDDSATTWLNGNTLTPGRWYSFVMSVTPNYSGNGRVRVWQDRALQFDNRSYAIGWDPSHSVDGVYGKPLNGFDVEVGLYRGAQNKQQSAYFDVVRWGDGFGDVANTPVPEPASACLAAVGLAGLLSRRPARDVH